ncbi:MAG: GNAT family N-acetyltransferase [Hungatella sp.]|nr:GNAT family N-acetyltransferase [Hungatella sp.]
MDFVIEKAVCADYQLFADIIQSVWDSMEQKDWFMADNADYTYHMLSTGQGTGYKAIHTGTKQVAGVFMTTIPGLDESNLGYDIGFSKSELLETAHMDSVAVLPQYRGQGLQFCLMQEGEKDLKERGFHYLLCTIHPQNRYSRNNALKQGYVFVLQKRKYNGIVRDILMKRI